MSSKKNELLLLVVSSPYARFRRRSTRVPNVTDELSTAKERCLNQFGAVKASSVTESVELLSNLS